MRLGFNNAFRKMVVVSETSCQRHVTVIQFQERPHKYCTMLFKITVVSLEKRVDLLHKRPLLKFFIRKERYRRRLRRERSVRRALCQNIFVENRQEGSNVDGRNVPRTGVIVVLRIFFSKKLWKPIGEFIKNGQNLWSVLQQP